MKINKDSWHARFHGDPLPENLCTYFWHWVVMVGAVTVFVTVLVAILTVTGFLIYIGGPERYVALTGLTIVGVLVASSNNIVRAYLKAKKEKYCPRIEWE